jgi:hypothetical protein
VISESCYLLQLPSLGVCAPGTARPGRVDTEGVEMGSELVQISALMGCAGVVLRYIIQLIEAYSRG